MDCAIKDLIEHLTEGKFIRDLSSELLKSLPFEYYLKVGCIDLLYIWSKLPYEYAQYFTLQIKLPCFIQYNRPSSPAHFDGPPNSQETWRYCIKAMQHML